MIIINADDWGRTRLDTDSTLSCFARGGITSVSAMVFMEDSERAAECGKESGLDIGLHLNFTERYTAQGVLPRQCQLQGKVLKFLTRHKLAQLVFNPALQNEFEYVYQAQFEEFWRLYGKAPSHVDGHQHMHLCANVLLGNVIPRGQRVRRSFSFWPGEKGYLNRAYRRLTDCWLTRRYRVTDFFFALSQNLSANRLGRVADLARAAKVELMTHARDSRESAYLKSDDFAEILKGLEKGSYALV